MAWMGGAAVAVAAAAAAAVKYCRYCGDRLDFFANFCPRCGREVPKPSESVIGLIALAIITLSLVAMFMLMWLL